MSSPNPLDHALDSAVGIISLLAAVGGFVWWIVTLLLNTFKDIRLRFHDVRDTLNRHNLEITVLKNQHQENVDRFKRLDDKLDRLDAKQDDQSDLLRDIAHMVKQRGGR